MRTDKGEKGRVTGKSCHEGKKIIEEVGSPKAGDIVIQGSAERKRR